MHFFSVAFAQQSTPSVAGDTADSVGLAGGEIFGFFTAFVTAVPLWIAAAFIFWISLMMAGFIEKLVVRRMLARHGNRIHQELVLLVERVVYFGIIILGAVISFGIVGIDLGSIIGFLGIGIGFSFKDILSNFIAGVVILTQKKINIGDLVRINERLGRVKDIDVRTTTLTALDGTELIVPNAEVLVSIVQNYTANTFRRITCKVLITYTSPVNEAINVCLGILKNNVAIAVEPAPEVYATKYDDFGINLDIRFWVETGVNWFHIRSQVIHDLQKQFAAHGIEFAYPTRTLYVEPQKKTLPRPTGQTQETPQTKNLEGAITFQVEPDVSQADFPGQPVQQGSITNG